MIGQDKLVKTAREAGGAGAARTLQKALGMRIRSLREQRGWTLRNLADAAGTSVSQIGKMERGECNVTLTTLLPVAEKLGITVCALFKGIG